MENQNVEWKENWHDDNLKGICAFANSQGGTMEIGRNDKGNPVRLAKVEKLLKDIPNKIRQHLGIVCEVNLIEKDNKQIISINVPPYKAPISYNGKYYIRSGGTTQELTGIQITEFLLLKQGRTWDSVAYPNITVDDLENDAFRHFRRRSEGSGRLPADYLNCPNKELLQKLALYDNEFLTRAALLLFHAEPQRYFVGSSVRVACFDDTGELKFQDEIEGPIIMQPNKVEELVYTKYFKGIISFEGMQRIETFPVPRLAFREALVNAIVHRDYSLGSTVQIKIYPNEVYIYSYGGFPQGWTVDNLFQTHGSELHNPLIAQTFLRAGFIDSWGSGIDRINQACKNGNAKPPTFKVNARNLVVIFETAMYENKKDTEPNVGINVGINVGLNVGLNETQNEIIVLMRDNPEITIKQLTDKIGIKQRSVERNVKVLRENGVIERVGAKRNGKWTVKKLL